MKGDVLIRGAPTSIFEDLYHFLVTSSWPALICLIAAAFTIAKPAVRHRLLVGPGIENARSGSFADMFFFSVQSPCSAPNQAQTANFVAWHREWNKELGIWEK